MAAFALSETPKLVAKVLETTESEKAQSILDELKLDEAVFSHWGDISDSLLQT